MLGTSPENVNMNICYTPFEESPISCFNLSGTQLVFSGLKKESGPFNNQTISYQTDIYDHRVYEPYIFINTERSYKNNRPKISYLNISELWWRHFLSSRQEAIAVGNCSVRIRVIWPAPDAFPEISNFEDFDQFEKGCFEVSACIDEESEYFLYPKVASDLIHHVINERKWIQANHGSYSVDREYSFYTAITPSHLLHISFRPQGYWSQGVEPPKQILDKVFASFWDFMDKLSIIEDKSQQTRTPGIELRGEMLERHRLKQEQAASEQHASGWGSEDHEMSGW
ncbi:hypothetical protein [Microbulbifer aggregans]|uniref:hypothetical protein n=1 Tax=Microbulbifer aggregans TaxID=1769779 RepID=UPI001CFC75F1|nr:hypothetical protein [Microbulbifer aggregans]